MKTPRFGKNICPKCGVRKRQDGRTYCDECERERKRRMYRHKHHPVSPAFRALVAEAKKINMAHLRDMGYIGRQAE